MRGSLAGHRYAKSLIGLSIEQDVLEVVYKDMLLISTTVEGCNDLGLLLKSPVVKTDKKQEILKAIFGKEASGLTKQFLQLISSRKRESLIGDIATGGSSYGMKTTLGPEGGGGGASRLEKSSKSNSSNVKSSAISSSSDGTGMDGLAGGGVLSICCV